MTHIKFKGCANFEVKDLVLIQYGEGSTVFICAKAAAGLLEKIVIKQYKIIKNHKTWGKNIIQYFDTYNRIWFGHELCLEADALISAQLYYEKLSAAISALECPPN